jgi:hypothetical protein
MAQVNEKTQAEVNWLLDYLEAALEDLAEIVDGWEDLDWDERVDFWAEWPLKEDKLAQLDQLAETDQLSPTSQVVRYRAIKQRLTTHRAALDRLDSTGQAITQGA